MLSNHDDVCAELSAFHCKRARYSNRDTEGVWFDVWLPTSAQRKFYAAEVSVAFRGRSSSAFFASKARRGSIELVSKTNTSATIVVDLEMDTGAAVKGRFVASSCAETAFVRPFGGLECVASEQVACDGGVDTTCWQSTESCTCGRAQSMASCTTISRVFPRQYLMTCVCTGLSPAQCSIPSSPPIPGPTCCSDLSP